MSIVLKDVHYTYMAGTPFERAAIQDINLEIAKGEFIAIIGHTGSGKSTLVQHLNGLLQPTGGSVLIDGIDLGKKGDAVKMAMRKVGMVFQYPEHQLFEETIYEDIAFGPRNMELPEEEVTKRVKEAMQFVSLEFDAYKDRSPFQLSGGQMRRVAIAGVIALQPEYLILDEPSAGLDPCGRDAIFAKIKDLYQKTKIGVILVSHNMDDAAKLAGRIIVMNHGRITMDAPPRMAFSREDELKTAGVDVPQMKRLMNNLREKGLAVDENALTVAAAVKGILTALGR